MKLAYLELCGFRGFNKPLRIEFRDGFTVIDGRNGVGKSTLFDAIEFALTGTISKYGSLKAGGETVADYFWWDGEDRPPSNFYVEAGFTNGPHIWPIRRSRVNDNAGKALSELQSLLCDMARAPESPLTQLCGSVIIRDELIAALSLDLKETERYERLRDAIGAIDADTCIARGAELVGHVKKAITVAQQEATAAGGRVVAASRRIDEIRGAVVSEVALAEAIDRLRTLAETGVSAEKLAEPARLAIVKLQGRLDNLRRLDGEFVDATGLRLQLTAAQQAVDEATTALEQAQKQLRGLTEEAANGPQPEALARNARDLAELVTLGGKVGLLEDCCPLCATGHTTESFAKGLAKAVDLARRVSADAVLQAAVAKEREDASARVQSASDLLASRRRALQDLISRLAQFEALCERADVVVDISQEDVRRLQASVDAAIVSSSNDLRLVETLKLNSALNDAIAAERAAKNESARAEKRLGLARKAEARALALHNAARRAAGEALDQRLERVLPLMSELYRRLRPHPVWGDIEYAVRGDVRRFLSLQVGDELNPQFMFSSGQRRATGLAFLLSINLSLAWSRWQSVLLDDPVQHVDDFRTLHLAEVLAQVVKGGKQVICAVEDAALAEMLCRRLPVERRGSASHVSLGFYSDGALAKISEVVLSPFAPRALLPDKSQAAG